MSKIVVVTPAEWREQECVVNGQRKTLYTLRKADTGAVIGFRLVAHQSESWELSAKATVVLTGLLNGYCYRRGDTDWATLVSWCGDNVSLSDLDASGTAARRGFIFDTPVNMDAMAILLGDADVGSVEVRLREAPGHKHRFIEVRTAGSDWVVGLSPLRRRDDVSGPSFNGWTSP